MRRVVHSCVICKKVEGVPYSVTSSPDLPKFRVSEDPPFTHTGLDFAGPLFIHDEKLIVPRREQPSAFVPHCATVPVRGSLAVRPKFLNFPFGPFLCLISCYNLLPKTYLVASAACIYSFNILLQHLFL